MKRRPMREVEPMDLHTAMLLLSKALPSKVSVDPSEGKRLLEEELTCLPLAIIQAAAYIKANGIAIAEYLSLSEAQEQEKLQVPTEHFGQSRTYPNQGTKNPVATDLVDII